MEEHEQPEQVVTKLPVKEIRRGPNDRTEFDPVGLRELADSIKEYGLQQPITVRPVLDVETFYEIVAGERRFLAVKDFLHWSIIPAIIRVMNDEEASAIMLAENIGRRDLNPMDEAFAYQKRITQFGWSITELSHKCGVAADRIYKRVKLINLRQDIQALVRSGQFPVGHAEYMAILDLNRQSIAARPIVAGTPINLREFKRVVDQLYAEQCQENLFDMELFGGVQQVETQMVIAKTVSIPFAKDLPPVKIPDDHHTGALIYGYIQDLQAQGFKREAEVAGTILYWLDRANFARLPVTTNLK